MEYTFKIKSGSSSEIYNIVFNLNELISINCNCKAGIVKMLCKHRRNLLDGDFTSLVNMEDSEKLSEVLSKIEKTKIANLFKELNEIEAKLKSLDSLKKKFTKELGRNISDGF